MNWQDWSVVAEWLPFAVVAIVGVLAVIADIRSADRALYFRMMKGDKA